MTVNPESVPTVSVTLVVENHQTGIKTTSVMPLVKDFDVEWIKPEPDIADLIDSDRVPPKDEIPKLILAAQPLEDENGAYIYIRTDYPDPGGFMTQSKHIIDETQEDGPDGR